MRLLIPIPVVALAILAAGAPHALASYTFLPPQDQVQSVLFPAADAAAPFASYQVVAGPSQVGYADANGSFLITQAVYRGPDSALTFAYQLTNTGASSLANVTLAAFLTNAATVGYLAAAPVGFSAGSVGFTAINRGARRANFGLYFALGGSGLAPGQSSAVFYASNGLAGFDRSGLGEVAAYGGGGLVDLGFGVPVYAPAAQSVPEPGSLALLGIACGAVGLLRRRAA